MKEERRERLIEEGVIPKVEGKTAEETNNWAQNMIRNKFKKYPLI